MADNASDNTNCTADSTPDNTNCTADNASDNTICTADSTPDNTNCTADNQPDNTICTADNRPDSTVCMADNTPDNTICTADDNTNCPADDRQNNDIFSKISILELQKKYGIGRDSLYKRMAYLQIATYKIKGKAYLDAEQTAHMDGLHDHIQATGKMEGYPIPEPSGPRQEEQEAEQTTALVEISEKITVSNNQQIENSPTATYQAVPTTASRADIEQIKVEAQQRVKAKRLAVIQVAKAYEENPNLLPEDIKAEIEAAEMAAISTPLNHKPYYEGNALAQMVIQDLVLSR